MCGTVAADVARPGRYPLGSAVMQDGKKICRWTKRQLLPGETAAWKELHGIFELDRMATPPEYADNLVTNLKARLKREIKIQPHLERLLTFRGHGLKRMLLGRAPCAMLLLCC